MKLTVHGLSVNFYIAQSDLLRIFKNVLLRNTTKVTILNRHICDWRILKAPKVQRVFSLLRLQIANVDIAHYRSEFSGFTLFIIKVDCDRCVRNLSDSDISQVNVLEQSAASRCS